MRVGVLTIGSLYWERDHWTDDVLASEQAVTVPFPIRYGRKSDSRDVGYTMVIARSAPLGNAKAIPATRDVQTVDDLRQLAGAVGDAEGIGSSLCCAWGCVALLVRDRGTDFTQSWHTFGIDASHIVAAYDPRDPPLDATGVLEPALWSPELDAFELLLATVTKPTKGRPTIEHIADGMGSPPFGNRAHHYFRSNLRAGITTFQDAEILATLTGRGFDADAQRDIRRT
jgi:hypothetical protein